MVWADFKYWFRPFEMLLVTTVDKRSFLPRLEPDANRMLLTFRILVSSGRLRRGPAKIAPGVEICSSLVFRTGYSS